MAGQPVVISYEELTSDADLSAQLEAAYGANSIGLLTASGAAAASLALAGLSCWAALTTPGSPAQVSGVPGFPELRQRLLPLAARMAGLPAEAKARCEDPASLYSFGWSEGKEQLEAQGKDALKGSYYANPLTDTPTDDPALLAAYPSYCCPNLWPSQSLPELEGAFKSLGRLIIEVGCLLAGHCDRYLAARGVAPLVSLRDTIERSPCPKARGVAAGSGAGRRRAGAAAGGSMAVARSPTGRLLHYFAPPAAAAAASAQPQQWCGWHLDHGSLTGLTSAMFLDGALRNVGASPDPAAGLYARTRAGEVVRAPIPPDHIAYQVQSGGLLQATPHCVVAPRPDRAAGVSRNTFAVFMQPRWDQAMALPEGADAAAAGVGQWRPGISFGEFSERTFQAYYSAAYASAAATAAAPPAAAPV
eukprot:scaffold4.g4815.t1